MRIERSICPLTMLVERSMLTMRIERSICPLTRWMFATILVRRRLWSFLVGRAHKVNNCMHIPVSRRTTLWVYPKFKC